MQKGANEIAEIAVFKLYAENCYLVPCLHIPIAIGNSDIRYNKREKLSGVSEEIIKSIAVKYGFVESKLE